MADPQTVIEGTLKYRDNKKWKPRWCVIRKLSPVADCLHLQLYRDSKDRCKNGPTKASLSLEGFLGMETGFTLDKESNTMALICSEVVVVLAFDSRELLIQWQVKVRTNLLEEHQFLVQIAHVPPRSKLTSGPARLHLLDYMFCLTAGVPPKLLGVWPLKELRRFGVVDGKFCFEGGSRCGKGEGLHVLLTNQAKELVQAFDMASRGRLPGRRKMSVRKNTGGTDSNVRSSPHSRTPAYCDARNDCANKNFVICSSESSANPLHGYVSDANEANKQNIEKKMEKAELGIEPGIRPCHVHYRWPSSVVPCHVTEKMISPADGQSKTASRLSAGEGNMLWSVGSCPACNLLYYKGYETGEKTASVIGNARKDDPRGFTPQWTMDWNIVSPCKDVTNVVCSRQCNRNRGKSPHDRSSLCSQSSQSSGTSNSSNPSSSSSSSSISEYSVPKNSLDSFYDRPRNIHHVSHHHSTPHARFSITEDASQNKLDGVSSCTVRGNLVPILESCSQPTCTCLEQRAERQQQAHAASDRTCTCTCRDKRNSAEVEMPSLSSSGSSNASPMVSPKKMAPVFGVPILLPCTCGKAAQNPYLNYAVPRSGAPVKVGDSDHEPRSNDGDNKEGPTLVQEESKIINKVDDGSSSECKEDNGNKTSGESNIETSKNDAVNPPVPQRLCPCQRLLLCPPSLFPSCRRIAAAAKESKTDDHVRQQHAEYGSVSRRLEGDVPTDSDKKLNEAEAGIRIPVGKQDQNLNYLSEQQRSAAECCRRGAFTGIPVVNTWKKGNANHIYVNLKYLQETAAALEHNQEAAQKLIPYYANLYFLQTLSLYENAGVLAGKKSNILSMDTSEQGAQQHPSAGATAGAEAKPIEKKKLELPTATNGIYEMMSFNREASPSGSSENYMLMRPIGKPEEQLSGSTVQSATLPSSYATEQTHDQDRQAFSAVESMQFGSSSSLPLRPFMPVLLPFHEHSRDSKRTDDLPNEDDSSKLEARSKSSSIDSRNRSSRSSSLSDIKVSVFRRGRSSSSDGRQCSLETDQEMCGEKACCSPKSTPGRKHPILTKLTFRSREKSFSTDEITPPSSAPSSPDSLFLENIHKYPFHRSADCLQQNEECRLSEEDLSQDPDVIMSQSLDKARLALSIKRSSSVPCKSNTAQANAGGANECCSSRIPVSAQPAIFSHFIAYHGSLPRRCFGSSAGRHGSTDKKPLGNNQEELQQPAFHASEGTNVIFISECKQCHQLVTSPEGLLVLDAKSMTSSSSSDMSDYIESLSLCSRSSSGSSGAGGSSGEYVRSDDVSKPAPSCTSSLRPRSGKEYQSVDRIILQDNFPCIAVSECSHLTLPSLKPFLNQSNPHEDSSADISGEQHTFDINSGQKANSPSPGYVSSSPGNHEFISPEVTASHFVFPRESKDLNYLEVVSVGESEPTSPAIKSEPVEYAVIDIVATTAAKKLSEERAHLRDSTSPSPKTSPKHGVD